jgi:ribosome biogenesis protein Tsr3
VQGPTANNNNSNADNNVEEKEPLCTVQSPWKSEWSFLKKVEIELPHDPDIPLLGI